MLRKYSSNEAKFTEFIAKLDQAVHDQTPFATLNGAVISREVMMKCLAEVRASCQFPIRPDAQPIQSSESEFASNLIKFAAAKNDRDPNVVPFVLLYLQFGLNVHVTLVKAGWSWLVLKKDG